METLLIHLYLQSLAICNAGLSTGLRAEDILNYVGTQVSIRNVIMVPGKSFCFLQTESGDESSRIYELLHGKTTLGQNGGCLYLSYCDRGESHQSNIHKSTFPDGNNSSLFQFRKSLPLGPVTSHQDSSSSKTLSLPKRSRSWRHASTGQRMTRV